MKPWGADEAALITNEFSQAVIEFSTSWLKDHYPDLTERQAVSLIVVTYTGLAAATGMNAHRSYGGPDLKKHTKLYRDLWKVAAGHHAFTHQEDRK